MNQDLQSNPVKISWSRPTFWRSFLLASACVLALSVLLNFAVDPFSIYGTGIFEPYRINSYIEKAELFARFDPPPEALIIGSSRTGSVDPEVVYELTGKICFNWSVPSAGIETAYAIVRMAIEDHGAPIDTVIVAVDPDAFNPVLWIHPQAQQASMYSDYLGESGAQSHFKAALSSMLRLLTIEQTTASVNVIRRELGDTSFDAREIYRIDGFALYIGREEQIESGTFDLNARITERLTTYPDENPCITGRTVLSRERMDLWVDFLEYCRGKEIQVYAYLPPSHPRFIELLKQLGAVENLNEISRFLETTSDEWGAVFRDYSDLSSIGGDVDQFYDEVHMRTANNDLLLIDLLSDNAITGGETE